MAFVRRRAGRWYMGWKDETGTQRQLACLARTKSEAKRMAEEKERKCERIRLGLEEAAPEPIPLKDVVAKYLAVVTAGQRSVKSTEGRIRLHILPTLGERLLHQIRPVDIETLLRKKAEEGYSAAQRRHIRVHLHSIFEFARKSMRVFPRDNPVDAVEQVKLSKKLPKFLTAAQAQRFLEAAGDWRLLMLTALMTGLRKGELCGLKWSDVDLERRVFYVARSYDHDSTKGGRARPVAIHKNLVDMLKAAKEAAKSEWVFPTPEGRMRRNFNAPRAVRACLRAAGLIDGFELLCRRKGCGHVEKSATPDEKPCPACGFALWASAVPIAITFKDLRSTFGTLAYEATGDIRFVQEQLGHQDVRTTEGHYSVLRAGHLIAQTDLIDLGGGSD